MELRRYADEDLALTIALETDPAVMHHLGGPVDRDALPATHARRLDDPWFFVVAEEPGGPAIGSIGVWESEHGGHVIHETGWMVLPAHQGKGVASAALRLLIERVTAAPRFTVIHAFPPVGNAPSNALCRKFGFELQEVAEFDFRDRTLRCNHWSRDVVR